MFTSFINRIKADSYLSQRDILKALDFATKAHEGQKRSSGQEYITHPIIVSEIVLDYLKDSPSVIASLLHDVVEDTPISLEDITKNFSGEVATLVEGVTKLNKIKFRDSDHAKAENFRKFILSISKDIRILIIKLADRLHNLRTIKFITNIDKQKAIALETLEIYVPLAERIGLTNIKDELEDLSFEVLYPDIRGIILQRLENYKSSINIDLTQIKEELESLLSKAGIKNFTLMGRIKRPYSIWNKMQKNEVDFEEINDLVAFRVILNNTKQCYNALGILHGEHKSFFSSFRDYISVAKDNGYQSIHTCILFRPALKIEIQIRTKEMHEVAENGLAAHWNYKNKVKTYDMREYMWLKNILEIVSSPFLEAKEKYEYSKLEMFDNEIFVFTPRGRIISLPKGSIVLDFAYAIHTDIGNTCVGAKINGEFIPMYYELENGSTVKIITSPNQEPDINLLNLVKTGLAISNIKRYWRNKKKGKIEQLIRNILEYTFKKEDLEYDDSIITKALEKYRLSTLEFYYGLLQGSITINEIIKDFYPNHVFHGEELAKLFEVEKIANNDINNYNKIYQANCCLPVLGDKIIGLLSLGRTIIAHRDNCKALYLEKNTRVNKINIKWANNIPKNQIFLAKLTLEANHRPGVIFNLSKIFYENNLNIIDLTTKVLSPNIKGIDVIFEVKNLEELTNLINLIEQQDTIKEVRRA